MLILVAICVASYAAAQKAVYVAPAAIFPFDPLRSTYSKQSLSPVDTYVRAWRAEGQDVRLTVCDTSLSDGYKIYLDLVDSTLLHRALVYIGGSIATHDTISKSDTLPPPNETLYDFPQSREFLTAFDADIERVKRFFATPLRILDSTARFDPYAPNDFSRLFHSFQLDVSGADLSIFAPPTFDAKLPTEIFIKTIYNLFYFDNELVTVRLSGREVKVLLEKIYSSRYFTLKSDRSDLLNYRAPAFMHSSLAGAHYEIDLTRHQGDRVVSLALQVDTIYSVVLNSFAAKEFKVLVKLGDYKSLLIKYLQGEIKTANRENWQLKPQRWVGEIKLREMETIFGKSLYLP